MSARRHASPVKPVGLGHKRYKGKENQAPAQAADPSTPRRGQDGRVFHGPEQKLNAVLMFLRRGKHAALRDSSARSAAYVGASMSPPASGRAIYKWVKLYLAKEHLFKLAHPDAVFEQNPFILHRTGRPHAISPPRLEEMKQSMSLLQLAAKPANDDGLWKLARAAQRATLQDEDVFCFVPSAASRCAKFTQPRRVWPNGQFSRQRKHAGTRRARGTLRLPLSQSLRTHSMCKRTI